MVKHSCIKKESKFWALRRMPQKRRKYKSSHMKGVSYAYIYEFHPYTPSGKISVRGIQ